MCVPACTGHVYQFTRYESSSTALGMLKTVCRLHTSAYSMNIGAVNATLGVISVTLVSEDGIQYLCTYVELPVYMICRIAVVGSMHYDRICVSVLL